MGIFDGEGFGLDKNSLILASLAQAAAQTAMPSRLPIPTGAVWGNLAGALGSGAKDYYGLEKDKLQMEQLKAQIPALQQQTAIRQMLADRIKQRMGGVSGRAPGIPQPSGAPGALAPPISMADDAAGLPARGGRLGFPALQQLAQQAGFKGPAADIMAATSLAESGGDPNAIGDRNIGGSYGLTQIHEPAHGPVAREALGNPLRAMQLAYDVSKGGTDFSPWTMWKNGGYRKYLPAGAGSSSGLSPQGAVPGSLSPSTGSGGLPPGIDNPYDLAVDRELAVLSGLGDAGKGMWDYYTSSPEYKGSVAGIEARARVAPALQEHAGKANIDLGNLPAQERIKADEAARLDALRRQNELQYAPQIAGATTDANEQAKLRYAPQQAQIATDAAVQQATRTPTGTMKEAQVYLHGTPEEQAALKEAATLNRAQTTINNVTNPIAKGVGDSFVSQRDRAYASADTIRGIHAAREQLDNGTYVGPGGDARAYLARVGELFGLPAETAANTAAFHSAMGAQVLSMVKDLGAGTSISNADREFARDMAGGRTDLGEASIRRALEIREKLERDKIKRYSAQADKLLGAIPSGSELQQVAPLLSVEEPPEYVPPKQRQGGKPGRLIYDPATGTLKPE